MVRLIMAALLLMAVPAQALELKGKHKQGALLFGETHPEAEVYLNERTVPVTPDGHFALGFGREAEPEHELRVKKPDGSVERHVVTIEQRDYHIQRVEGVPHETVTPDPKHLERIRNEASRVRQARAEKSEREDFLGDYIWPVEGPITGVYGSQRYFNGEPRQPHYGVDVAAPEGTEVMAPADGRVTLAEDDLFFSGGTLIIDHGYGVSSTLMHLSRLHVDVGDEVRQGDLVAEVGATGRATGPHLDWRMNWFSERIDPTTIAPELVGGHTPGAARD